MGTVTAAQWKQLLLNALECNAHLKHSSFFQIATIGTNGRPSNRTVVFRGFQENTENLQIYTDSRSRKIEEVKHCSYAEISWYFTDSWEQFRINGRIDVIDGLHPDPHLLEQREKCWNSVSKRSRMQYIGPNPGFPYLGEQSSEESLQDSTSPVSSFCLMLLAPDQVDYLNLKKNERFVFKSGPSAKGEKVWTSERINP